MNRAHIWANFFAGIVAFQYHPRNEPAERMTIRECAEVADEMMQEFERRVQNGLD